MCVGTTSGCHLRRQWDWSAKGESSPCRISLLNPLLWLAPSQQRKGTKLPGRLWQATPLPAGQKLIPSSSPVPPAQGAGLARLAFCVSLSGGVKGRKQASRGWSNQQCSSPDRRTDRCPILVPLPAPRLSTRLCLRHVGKKGGGHLSPQTLQAPHRNEEALNYSRTRTHSRLTAPSTVSQALREPPWGGGTHLTGA